MHRSNPVIVASVLSLLSDFIWPDSIYTGCGKEALNQCLLNSYEEVKRCSTEKHQGDINPRDKLQDMYSLSLGPSYIYCLTVVFEWFGLTGRPFRRAVLKRHSEEVKGRNPTNPHH